MKIKIILKVHPAKGASYSLLEHQDIYEFIGESTVEEIDLAFYISKWCDWLNHYVTDSVPVHGDIKGTELRSWIQGYNYAKHVDETEFSDSYVLSMKGYLITIYKPYTH